MISGYSEHKPFRQSYTVWKALQCHVMNHKDIRTIRRRENVFVSERNCAMTQGQKLHIVETCDRFRICYDTEGTDCALVGCWLVVVICTTLYGIGSHGHT
jgi:hypothetical protein